jgi:hypothetical protein
MRTRCSRRSVKRTCWGTSRTARCASARRPVVIPRSAPAGKQLRAGRPLCGRAAAARGCGCLDPRNAIAESQLVRRTFTLGDSGSDSALRAIRAPGARDERAQINLADALRRSGKTRGRGGRLQARRRDQQATRSKRTSSWLICWRRRAGSRTPCLICGASSSCGPTQRTPTAISVEHWWCSAQRRSAAAHPART